MKNRLNTLTFSLTELLFPSAFFIFLIIFNAQAQSIAKKENKDGLQSTPGWIGPAIQQDGHSCNFDDAVNDCMEDLARDCDGRLDSPHYGPANPPTGFVWDDTGICLHGYIVECSAYCVKPVASTTG